MKKVLMFLIVMICSLNVQAQSSVVQMGEAVIRCNDFAFAKKMLLNENLSVDKSSKSNSANCVVLTNGSESTYRILYVILRKSAKSNKVASVTFKFNPNGKYFHSLASDQIQYGYSYDRDNDTDFRELYSNGNKHMALDINSKGWMVAKFFRK